MSRRLTTRLLLALLGTLVLSSCAARRPAVVPEPDPLQSINRPIFWFNDKVDVWVLEPTARGWRWVAPGRVRGSVRNFFTNLRFPSLFANDLLQGKPLAAGVDVMRFTINTTVGVAGFFDPAKAWWGLQPNAEDFGQTLGVWGLPTGPYLMVPILGPSSVRDGVGRIVDSAFAVTPFFVDSWILVAATAFDTVNERSYYIEEVESARRAALDYYLFVRNAYFQRRDARVYDAVEEETRPEHPEDLYIIDPTW